MLHRLLSFRVFFLVLALVFSWESSAQSAYKQKHLNVALRMIGHRVLLMASDSTSRVLPIEKVGERYLIQFEREFGFNPDDLIGMINEVLKDAGTVKGYIVEVEKCATDEVVYSFEMGDLFEENTLPCRGRDQPKACYRIFLSLKEFPVLEEETTISPASESQARTYLLLFGILLVAGLAWILLLRKRRRKVSAKKPHAITIGAFQFDPRKATLYLAELEIELSSKESDLLILLFEAANTTVSREIILNRVWGDEGDYVGRTLDVFISKLRKKLEADASVKVVNVRGVGYKLVLDA